MNERTIHCGADTRLKETISIKLYKCGSGPGRRVARVWKPVSPRSLIALLTPELWDNDHEEPDSTHRA